MTDSPSIDSTPASKHARFLFATCFVALVATSFAFMIRVFSAGDWAKDFNLSETAKGELLGAGIWPFAISIILFSLVIDRIGYGKAMAFAFVAHAASAALTAVAWDYYSLYAANVLAALAAGAVEAAINPVIAAMYPRAKTLWLNILHAGWPGGLILCGLLTLSFNPGGPFEGVFGEAPSWRIKAIFLLLPTLIYGFMLLRAKFPVSERVAVGVPYRTMLREFGAGGALIAFGLIGMQLAAVAGLPIWSGFAAASVVAVVFGIWTGSLGRPLFLFLLLIMILLATTEIGTDGWIRDLMGPIMQANFGIDGGWVLVYTATIMMVLRLFAGPVTRVLNPLGILAASCVFAAAGLFFLSEAQGKLLVLAATVYGIGQTFFWPTTLGLVAERFPKGGALTLNAVAGVGMLGVGVLGFTFLGQIQDHHADRQLAQQNPALHQALAQPPARSVLGAYQPLDDKELKQRPKEDQAQVTAIKNEAKKQALTQVAVLPLIMLACYLALLVYFKKQGGYKAIDLTHDPSNGP
ncbi:MAG: MFS transporter [Planctomycetota bacterium]